VLQRTGMRRECGLTLVELLVVVAIVGLLAGIAVQSYAAYRQRAYDAQVLSDIGNARVAEEAYYSQSQVYRPVPAVTGGPIVVEMPGFVVSASVTIEVTVPAPDNFVVVGTSSKGSGLTFTYDNTVGRIVGQ